MNFINLKKITIIALFTGLLQGCFETAEIKQRKPLTVTSFTVQKPTETQFRNFKGTVVPSDLTPLSFRLGGEIDSILVRDGEHVKKGQLLAKLDSSKLNQQLVDAQAQYELAVKQQQRAQDLIRRKMISQSELDELTTSKRIAQVKYQVAQNKIKYTHLTAPFSGFISAIPKQSYESVNPGETILSLYRDDVVRVRINVSNNVLARIDPDRNKQYFKVQTTFSGDDRIHTLIYHQHTSEPAEGGTAFAIWLEMPQVNPAILPGTSASLNVDMVEAGMNILTGYVVPMTALDAGSKDGEFYIWKLVDGKVHKQPADIMQITKDGAIIGKGLRSGDILASSQLSRLRDNTVVATADKEEK